MASTKKIISGATLGTLLGSLGAMLYPRRNEIMEYVRDHADDFNNLKDIAKEYGNNIFNRSFQRRDYRGNYLKAGVAGFILGAGAALLLAPKTGRNLRGQLTRAYNGLSEKSEELIHQFKNNSYHPFAEARSAFQNGAKKKKAPLKRTRKH